MKIVMMLYKSTDSGFCRVTYYTKNESGQKIHYCLMEEGIEVKLYRTSGGDFDEPMYEVRIKENVKVHFEVPSDEYGQKLLSLYKEVR